MTEYKLQFETDDYDKFRYVEEAARRCVDNRHIEVCSPVQHGHCVHAHWEYHESVCTDEGITGVYVCSACKAAVPEAVFDFFMEGFHKDFCGACGAQMDEEENER